MKLIECGGERSWVTSTDGYAPGSFTVLGTVSDGTDTNGLIWDGTAIVENMAALRSAKKALVRARRDEAEWAGCTSPSGPIDTDPDSQRKIGGAATLAVVGGASFSIQWRMKDNTMVTLNAAGMIALGAAVAGHVGACQARKNALDAAIAAASTAAALAAIEIEAGWP